MNDAMKIKSLAPWFGGKRKLAPKIVELLGPHRSYWEPFCGSMAVLMLKPPCEMETVNDLHGDLINLALVIQDNSLGPKLYRRLKRTLMSEGLFKEAAERYNATKENPAGKDIDRAYDYFLCSWLGRNGVAGTASYKMAFCARYTANGGHAAKRWSSVISSIPAWRRRLANVTILQRDAFEILDKIEDRKGTVIYVDPPYFVKGAKYVHDFDNKDHLKRAQTLGRFKKTRVVVSYYDDERLVDMYPGWDRKEIIVSKAMANQGARGSKNVKAKEVLLVNSKIEKFGLFGG